MAVSKLRLKLLFGPSAVLLRLLLVHGTAVFSTTCRHRHNLHRPAISELVRDPSSSWRRRRFIGLLAADSDSTSSADGTTDEEDVQLTLEEMRQQLLQEWGLKSVAKKQKSKAAAAASLMELAQVGPSAFFEEGFDAGSSSSGSGDDAASLDINDQFEAPFATGTAAAPAPTAAVAGISAPPSRALSKRDRKKQSASERKRRQAEPAAFVVADPAAEAVRQADPAKNKKNKQQGPGSESSSGGGGGGDGGGGGGGGDALVSGDQSPAAVFEREVRAELVASPIADDPDAALLLLGRMRGLPSDNAKDDGESPRMGSSSSGGGGGGGGGVSGGTGGGEGSLEKSLMREAVLLALSAEYGLRSGLAATGARRSAAIADESAAAVLETLVELNALLDEAAWDGAQGRFGVAKPNRNSKNGDNDDGDNDGNDGSSNKRRHKAVAAHIDKPLHPNPLLSAGQCNELLRWCGKAQVLPAVAAVLDMMGSHRVPQTAETFEFVGNAFVKEVELEARADAMSRLPSAFTSSSGHDDGFAFEDLDAASEGAAGGGALRSDQLKEVVFVGRSNVGKSSLVNMLCSRSALASTSSEPGHTKHFFFYRVNAGRGRSGPSLPVAGGGGGEADEMTRRRPLSGVPEFRLVDVPGMGFTSEAVDEDKRASWRGLLERYLTVRGPLRVVFHLIDAKAGPQSTDRDLMLMAARALTSRTAATSSSSSNDEAQQQQPVYVVVLTKADKVSAQDIASQVANAEAVVRETFLSGNGDEEAGEGEGGPPLATPEVIVTSSKARPPLGRDRMWRYLSDALLD